MEKPPFEDLTCFVCDFGHWVLLGAVVVGLGGYFTRDRWWPAAPTPTPAVPTPAATPIPTLGPEASPDPTVPPTPELYGYTNSQGGYAFNYPVDWQGEEAGANAHFFLPDGSKVEVVVLPAGDTTTLDSLVEDSGPLPTPPSEKSEAIVAGAPALRQDLFQADGTIFGRSYVVFHSGQAYYIQIFSPAEAEVPGSFEADLAAFEEVLDGFMFLEDEP